MRARTDIAQPPGLPEGAQMSSRRNMRARTDIAQPHPVDPAVSDNGDQEVT